MDKKLETYLKKYKINYTEHEHPAIFTVEESHILNQHISGLHCKCLFLKDDKQRFYLVAMPAEKRLDINLLKTKLSVKKIRFASPKELKQELNLTPGSVSIFGMINAKITTLIIDEEVWQAEKTGFHPNINTATLEINRKDLERFYHSLTCEKEVMRL